MATHIRRQIRDRLVKLLTGLTATGSNVYPSRVYALNPDLELPALLIYSPVEEITKTTLCHPGEIERTISFSIEAIATATTTDLDDRLDEICQQVEVKMATDFYLQNLAKEVSLVRTEIQLQGGDSAKPVGSARMTWTITTATIEGIPDVVH